MRILRVDIPSVLTCLTKGERQYISEGGILLEKKKQNEYTIEREFLSKFSTRELLIRIIKTHVNQQVQKRG